MKRKDDYDARRLTRDYDAAYTRTFVTALGLSKNKEFYVTLDGASKPFYGKSYRFPKRGKRQAVPGMTPAGYAATGAFRGVKNGTGGSPMYRGAIHKHDWFQMVA